MKIRPRAALAVAVLLAPLTVFQPQASGRDEAGRFSMVRFDSRITDEMRDAVQATGADVIYYEPTDSYIVWATPDEAAAVSSLASVRSVQPVPVERKLHPDLKDARGNVYVHATVSGGSRDALERLDGRGTPELSFPARADGRMLTIGVDVPAARLPELAADPAVLYVNPASRTAHLDDELTDQINAGNVTPGAAVAPGYRNWLAAHGIDGTGVRVAVVDTGVDSTHPDLQSRVAGFHEYRGFPWFQVPFLDDFGHGTHVAGIVAGRPPVGVVNDVRGFTFGLGVAPGAEIIDVKAIPTIRESFPHPDGFQRYTEDSWRSGARLWNASWNTGGVADGYTADTQVMDVLSRDADFSTPGVEEFLMVFSAGNAGQSGPTTPHEAKNILAVGSTDSGRLITVNRISNDYDQVSSFSSRGPSGDGRIFPHLSAPGGAVVSARSAVSATTALCPTADATPLYVSCSGTSMAAPHAAGSAALIHEWWAKTHAGALPSPALVKALLINGARDVGFRNIPNRDEGWGRIDMEATIGPDARIALDQVHTFGGPGEQTSLTVRPDDLSKPLKITLNWSDAPGAVGASPALVNDLDLIVEQLDAGGNVVATWVGNRFAGGRSVSGGTADRLNNTENVYLIPDSGQQLADATYRVTVKAENVPGDGVPHNADTTDQDFALVVRNAVSN